MLSKTGKPDEAKVYCIGQKRCKLKKVKQKNRNKGGHKNEDVSDQ